MSHVPDAIELALKPLEVDRLRTFLDSWPKKTREERSQVKEMLITEFCTQRELDADNWWARAYFRYKISSWMSNHAATRDSRLPKALKMIWSGREVFYLLEDKAIDIRTKEIMAAESKIFIAALNAARSEMWNDLSEEKKCEWEEKADQWTMDGPDPELRATIAEKRLGDWIQSFVLWVYDQCQTMGKFKFCFVDTSKEMKYGRHDISMVWHAANADVPTYSQWKKDHPKASWRDYCHASLVSGEHGDDQEAPRATVPPHKFNFFDDGTPILPPLDAFRHSKDQCLVMHSYLSLHWEAASGIEKLAVAWKAVAKDTSLFLSPNALPSDCVFQNPHRMSGFNVRSLWAHVIKLQEGETWQDRFHWTHWWERAGTGEDSGERHEALYGRPSPAKDASKGKAKAHQAKRIKIIRAPPKGAFGLNKPSGENGEPEGGSSGGATKKTTSKPTRKKSKKSKGKSKGKGKQRKNPDSEESAVSSGAPSEEDEMDLGTDADSPDEEIFDMNVSGTDGEDFFALEAAGIDPSAPGPAAPGPSVPKKGPPKPRPVKRPMASSSRTSERASGNPSEGPSEHPTELGRIPPGPCDDAPVGPKGLATVRIPPTKTAITQAQGQRPSYVEQEPERILPFLWSLSTETDYREFLKSWRHMFRRRATLRDSAVAEWANWDSDCWGVPSHLHESRKGWASVLDWISDCAPTLSASQSEVQQWALVVGLMLRDTYTVNDIEPDEDAPVPNDGPDYLRRSTATLADALEVVLPLCLSSQHLEGEPDNEEELPALVPPAALSRKKTRFIGKKGKPPGIALGMLDWPKYPTEATEDQDGDTSCDEVEMAVERSYGSASESEHPSVVDNPTLPATTSEDTSGRQRSALRRARQLRQCYIELAAPRSRRGSRAGTHQPAPEVLPQPSRPDRPALTETTPSVPATKVATATEPAGPSGDIIPSVSIPGSGNAHTASVVHGVPRPAATCQPPPEHSGTPGVIPADEPARPTESSTTQASTPVPLTDIPRPVLDSGDGDPEAGNGAHSGPNARRGRGGGQRATDTRPAAPLEAPAAESAPRRSTRANKGQHSRYAK